MRPPHLDTLTPDTGTWDAVTPWDRPGWRAEASAWITASLAAHGRRPAGPAGVRLRPWSVVLRVPADDGRTAWFKANPPGSAFEPALNEALFRHAPTGSVLRPLATAAARAWSLIPDGGPLLREHPVPGGWPEVLRRYAALQRALAPHTAELAALGVPDAGPARLPDLLAARLDDADLPLAAGERAALRRELPRLREEGAELAAYPGVPSVTLDHADLHTGSVLTGSGRPVFFDWGDSCLAHPFTSLLVALRVVRDAEGAAAADRARDAYLATWGDPVALRRPAELACRLAAVIRADSWNRVFPANAVSQSAHSAWWLRRLLPDSPTDPLTD